MTKLELRIKMTVIMIKEKYKDIKSLDFDERQDCFWIEQNGFQSFNLIDLKDKALCFDLMIEHGVMLGKIFDKFSASTFTKENCAGKLIEVFDTDPQTAIYKAIIEKAVNND